MLDDVFLTAFNWFSSSPYQNISHEDKFLTSVPQKSPSQVLTERLPICCTFLGHVLNGQHALFSQWALTIQHPCTPLSLFLFLPHLSRSCCVAFSLVAPSDTIDMSDWRNHNNNNKAKKKSNNKAKGRSHSMQAANAVCYTAQNNEDER